MAEAISNAGYDFAGPAGRRDPLRAGLGRVMKRALAWRYRNFRPGGQPTRWRRVGGERLLVMRGVFDPGVHFTSDFMARYLRRPGVVRPGSSVLDLGTGSGILAIAAACAGASDVVAVDVDPAAAACARANIARLVPGDRVTVLEGDLFDCMRVRRFDLVVCNPPYFRGEPRTPAERAYYAGESYEWLDHFSAQLADHLEPGGKALVVLGDAADLPSVLSHLAGSRWHLRPVARKDILVEVLYVFEMRPLPIAPGDTRLTRGEQA